MTCHISLGPKPLELIGGEQNIGHKNKQKTKMLSTIIETGVFARFVVRMTYPRSTVCNRGSVGGCEVWSPLQNQSLLI